MSDYEITRLQEILQQLEAMAPLPAAGTPEALQDHEGWMQARTHIRNIVQRAEDIALMSVPFDVAQLLTQIENRKWQLLNLPLLMKPVVGQPKGETM